MLGLKGNQGTLHDEVKLLMDEAVEHDFVHMEYDFHETVDGDHGRIEHRKVWCTHDVDWFNQKDQWPGLRSFVMVQSHRTVGKKITCQRRYFISNLDGTDAKRAAHVIRSPWGIENSVHWVLDVAFDEDQNRVRQGNAASKMSLLRRIALNLVKNNKSIKVASKPNACEQDGTNNTCSMYSEQRFKCDGPGPDPRHPRTPDVHMTHEDPDQRSGLYECCHASPIKPGPLVRVPRSISDALPIQPDTPRHHPCPGLGLADGG